MSKGPSRRRGGSASPWGGAEWSEAVMPPVGETDDHA